MPLVSSSRRHLTRLLLLVAMLLTATGGAAQALPTASASNQLATTVLPEWQDELTAVLDDASAAYTIDAEVALPSQGAPEPQVRGSVEITYTNTTGQPLDALPFRFYANGPDANHDAMRTDAVTRDGAPATSTLSDDQTTLSIQLDPPLEPEAETTVAMEFTLAVPVSARDHYGILNIDVERGTWALAHWYPIVAGWDPERGWVLDPPSVYGDPIFSDIASYDVTLRTPTTWRVVSSGVITESTETGSVTETRIVTGPSRDVTVVLDNDFASVETVVGGTSITSWYNPADERIGQAVLDYAAQALAYFNDVIGPYPYTTLDLAPVDLFGAAGVEFPQLIYIGASYYTPDYSLEAPNSLDFTVAHEVLHQWWYGTVGNNQYDHAFIDEGLTNFMSSQMYFTAMYGPEAGETMVDRYLAGPFHSNVETDNDQVVDTPTDAFPSGSAYVFAAYSKGPMGFRAIYEAIGHDAFVAGVQQYYADHRFSIASPDDLLAAFEAAAGQDLDALWSHWFEQAAGRDDV
jgi:hypothetical protein